MSAAVMVGCGSPTTPPRHIVAAAPPSTTAPPAVVTLPNIVATTTTLPRASRSHRRTPRTKVTIEPWLMPHYADVDGMPGQLRRIGGCESAGSPTAPINWTAQNRRSTASGGFQIIDSTWRSWAVRYGSEVGAPNYAKARLAPPSVQLTVALGAYQAGGTSPWKASRGCWA